MHFLVGAALIAALIGFTFGMNAARVFVGLTLAAFASVVLLVVVHSAQGISESSARAAAMHQARVAR
jgi:hypothetical protein